MLQEKCGLAIHCGGGRRYAGARFPGGFSKATVGGLPGVQRDPAVRLPLRA